MTSKNKKALIYGYVASALQDNGETGLVGQEKRCGVGANELGLEVEAIFTDHAIEGGIFERSGIASLLKHIESHPDTNYVVIIDDLKRVGRNSVDHLTFKEKLKEFGATTRCLNNGFTDTPESNFIEMMMVLRQQYVAEAENAND